MTDTPNVVSLVERRNQPAEDVVGLLESWLERARGGELVSVAVAGVDREGASMHAYTTGWKVSLIGALTLLQHRVVTWARNGSEDGWPQP